MRILMSCLAVLFLCGPAWAVEPSTYVTHHEIIPNFAVNPTVTSAQSGDWTDTDTWQEDRVPGADDVVLIQEGHGVLYDSTSQAELAAMNIAGSLIFQTDANTHLHVGTLLVSPNGALTIGTETTPVASTVTAEIVLANRPVYTTSADPDTGVTDPRQFGTGLIVLGNITIAGAPKTPTWMRLASEPLAEQTTLTLRESVSGWKVGDRIVLPDTRHPAVDNPVRASTFSQTEALTISAISGTSVTLTNPLEYSHKGARDPDGTPTLSHSGETLLPHVGNLTRNVIVRSASPTGTRAHVMFTDHAVVDVRYAAWIDLGRTLNINLNSSKFDSSGNVTHIGTNQIGRYPVHFHHLLGPRRDSMSQGLTAAQIRSWLDTNGWQYNFHGNAIATSSDYLHNTKWAVAVHGTHFGRITENVTYNAVGAAFQTEDGGESYNLFADNFAAFNPGEGRITVPKVTSDPDVTGNLGRDGSGFWFRGPQNWVEGNVAADARFAGHYYSGYYLKDTRTPKFPGANTMLTAEGTTVFLRPLLSFKDNEAYGNTQNGLYGAWVSSCCNPNNWPEMLLERFTAWHFYFMGIEWYHNGTTTFTDLLMRGDTAVTSQPASDGRDMTTRGLSLVGYENLTFRMEDADIRGLVLGVDLPRNTLSGTPTVIQGGVLENYVNIQASRAHVGTTTVTKTHIVNVDQRIFVRNPPTNALAKYIQPYTLFMDYNAKDPAPADRTTLTVEDYDQTAGHDFQAYYREQSAPCSNTLPDVHGWVCGAGPPPPPSAAPTAPTNLEVQ